MPTRLESPSAGPETSLANQNLLFLDVQTTGIRPPTAQVLELGMVLTSSGASKTNVQVSQRFGLRNPENLTKRIREITGLNEEHLAEQPEFDSWMKREFADILEQGFGSISDRTFIIHGAPFETAFIGSYLRPTDSIICTQKLTHRLLPHIPSRNIRAVAGHFGYSLSGPNRAVEFAQATRAIWLGLAQELKRQGIATWSDLERLLTAPIKKTLKPKYQYKVASEKRLQIPPGPGVYRMHSAKNEILYVGKATSLKSRFNSYFRGRKGREARKLEMMAQVWDFSYVSCATPLEAALLEVEEIKKWDPPYNVSLKNKDRKLKYFNRDLSASRDTFDSEFFYGPYRHGSWLEVLLGLHRAIEQENFSPIFFEPLDPVLARDGFELFKQQFDLVSIDLKQARGLLALAIRHSRRFPVIEKVEKPEILTVEYLAGKFHRLFQRAGAERKHYNRLARLIDCEIHYCWKQQGRSILIQEGKVTKSMANDHQGDPRVFPLRNFRRKRGEMSLEQLDFASVLNSEIERIRISK